ncbi:MAG: two-component system regulatory protein YycI [Dethiobacteria bacterium]
MDLSKAKTVLIITFLFLNFFLLYQILEDEGRGRLGSFGRNEELSRLEIALQEVNLSLDVPLPKGGMQVAHLVVEPFQFQVEDIVDELWKLFGEWNNADIPVVAEEAFSEAEDEKRDFTEYTFGEYEMIVRKEGSISIKTTGKINPHYNNDNNSMEKILQSAQKGIEGISFMSSFIYDYSQMSQKGPVLNFRQEYDGFPLYAGYFQLFMHGLKPEGCYLYCLEPVGFAEQKREVIPPTTALLRLIEAYKGGTQETSIIDFSLGYYSQEYDAERWEIPPVWRIRLDNGEVYYINAFTGNLER